MKYEVKWFNWPKGYGFAVSPEGDIMLHIARYDGQVQPNSTISGKMVVIPEILTRKGKLLANSWWLE